GELDVKKNGLPRVYDADLQEPTYFYIRGDDRTPAKSKPIAPGVPEGLGGHFPDIQPVTLPLAAYSPEKRDFVPKEVTDASEATVSKAGTDRATAQRAASLSVLHLLGSAPLGIVGVHKGFEAVEPAELDVTLMQARHAALVAAVQAEQLEDVGKKESEEGKQA